MDPQSQAFTPYSSNNDTWRLQTEVARLQQLQTEHAERIARLERRQDEDARVKSVWGNSSPFPSVLSGGTPQQAPLQQPQSDHFRNFDDEANNLMSSLHLDAEEEPRRGMGANSRANSVRFDESANQNHFAHSSRPSFDHLSRSSSGLGGLQLNERSASHKSDVRASSAHSIRSGASGRANSLNLDTTYGAADSTRSPLDTPALAPGLLLLGSVPAIIRCWMNTNFKHDALLYAAICTGSYKSYLDIRLIEKLGFEDQITTDVEGIRSVELPVYFPEAVPHPASSRSNSPAPQLPSLTANFLVADASSAADCDGKSIQIFLGSDVLRSHNADILFSSNSVTLFDDDRSKLSIPLVRPENEGVFKTLYTASSAVTPSTALPAKKKETEQAYVNGLDQDSSASVSSSTTSPPPGKYRPPGATAAEASALDPARAGAASLDLDTRPASRASTSSRPSLTLLNARPTENTDTAGSDASTQQGQLRSASGTPATWSSWRRDGATPTSATAGPSPSQSTGLDWASASKNRETTYQRKDTGIKVLKPKSTTRTFSTSASTTPTAATATASPTTEGKTSRFFGEGRRRSGIEIKPGSDKKENAPPLPPPPSSQTPASTPKTRANPVGGASAFSWLTPGSQSATK